MFHSRLYMYIHDDVHRPPGSELAAGDEVRSRTGSGSRIGSEENAVTDGQTRPRMVKEADNPYPTWVWISCAATPATGDGFLLRLESRD